MSLQKRRERVTFLCNEVTNKLINDLKNIEDDLPACAEKLAVEHLRLDLTNQLYNNAKGKRKADRKEY